MNLTDFCKRSTFEQGISANPNNAAIHANYAQYIFEDCCGFTFTSDKLPDSKSKILALLNRALALDPKNEIALSLINSLKSIDPGFEYTHPQTIPPTPTSLYTATPSVTSTIAPTHLSLPQPIIVTSIVTVIHTKIVKLPTLTPIPSPTGRISPTGLDKPVDKNESSTANFIFGGLVVFITGIGAGFYFSKRK
ncbi:MAG: hypothetical protein QM730_07320 [Anaerolineales bacterium]